MYSAHTVGAVQEYIDPSACKERRPQDDNLMVRAITARAVLFAVECCG